MVNVTSQNFAIVGIEQCTRNVFVRSSKTNWMKRRIKKMVGKRERRHHINASHCWKWLRLICFDFISDIQLDVRRNFIWSNKMFSFFNKLQPAKIYHKVAECACVFASKKKAYKIHVIYLIHMMAIERWCGVFVAISFSLLPSLWFVLPISFSTSNIHCSQRRWFMTALNWTKHSAHKFAIFMKKSETETV